MEEMLNPKLLDKIINQTLESIDSGKKDIFDISESARSEMEKSENEMKRMKAETETIMNELEILEEELLRSRHRLIYVNQNFAKFSEKELKDAYEEADDLRVHVAVLREKEKNMIQRRSDAEVRFKNSSLMLRKADGLISKISVVFDFLSDNLKGISDKIDGMSQKQILGIKVIKAQEEERHRVAREIHDGPAQLMANIVLKAEICEKLVNIDINKAKEELNNLKSVVRESLQDVRRIIYDLRPMSLDDLGLVPTVQRYATKFGEDNNIRAKINVVGEFEDIKSIVNVTTFRIIQESLNNIKKHANANNIIVSLEDDEDVIKVIIEDDGRGFDTTNLKNDSENINSGFGLFGMQERVSLINGYVNIDSTIGKGTKILVVIPKNIGEGE